VGTISVVDSMTVVYSRSRSLYYRPLKGEATTVIERRIWNVLILDLVYRACFHFSAKFLHVRVASA